jgi:arylformamidase
MAMTGLVAVACSVEADERDVALPATTTACVPERSVDRDVAYGTDPLQAVDVYPAPAERCGQNPVVLWVHGGAWRIGDKGRLDAKQAWAEEHGWVLASVNYRLTPPARYPDHNDDVADALSWVVDHISGYGGDPGRVALIGHSAGAQIVSSIGVDERHGDPGVRDSIRAVVSLDTEGYDVAGRIGESDRAELIYRSVFGNRPSVWADASPINHVDGTDAPQLVVRRGTTSRQHSQMAFVGALREAGVATVVVATPDYSHRDVKVFLGSPEDDVLTPEVERFLEEAFS